MFRPFILPATALMLCTTPCMASGDNVKDASVSPENAFNALDGIFLKCYNEQVERNQKAARPLIVVTGNLFNCYAPDGTEFVFDGNSPSFADLKSVSHLGPFLFAVGTKHWINNDEAWKSELTECRLKIQVAQKAAEKVDWSSDAWPGGESKVKKYVLSSLKKVDDFAKARLDAGTFTCGDYEAFALDYTPNMVATFYLTNFSSVYQIVQKLKKWKDTVGAEAWERLYVVIGAGQGRTTAGLTPETNPAAVIIASVMSPKTPKSHMVMDPGSKDITDALVGLGRAITAGSLADTSFTTAEAKKVGGFYDALHHSEIPLATYDVTRIAKDFADGTAKDPMLVLGLQK